MGKTKSKVTYKEKIDKITSDIEQVKKTIAENQKKLSELEETKISMENAEIISIIRQKNLSVDDVAELIAEYKSEKTSASSNTFGGNGAVGVNTILKGNVQK